MQYQQDASRPVAGPLAGLLAAVLVLAGCETGVDPLADEGRYYSIFGYLDAGADTQFVRVRPLWVPALPPGPVDAVVTLEELETGAVAVLRDTVLAFREGAVHAFWSTAPVVHERSYRLTATRSDGAVSTAVVTLPPVFPAPLAVLQPSMFSPPVFLVRVAGAERLADLRLDFVVRDAAAGDTFAHSIPLRDRVIRTGGHLEVGIQPFDTFFSGRFAASCPAVLAAEVVVAVTAADWPFLDGVDLETLVRPDLVANVENGVGFLGAVSSVVIPAPDLAGHLAGLQEFCRLCDVSPNRPGCRVR